MTATLDPTTAYDELGADIEPGTLCWVRPDDTVPPLASNKRSLAVFTGSIGAKPWLLLLPTNNSGDGGWHLNHRVTDQAMSTLNLTRFTDSHRGWWLSRSDFNFIERALGYWCTTHQVFHAAETCPPEEYGVTIARLEKDLAEARAANAALVKDHEEFKVRASDILAEAANEHDLCDAYDRVCESAGLYPRLQNTDVEIEVTYRQTITVRARNYEAAADLIESKAASSCFEPASPFADASDIEEHSRVYSLDINVPD